MMFVKAQARFDKDQQCYGDIWPGAQKLASVSDGC
jgi:hypothetical protein